MQVKHLEKGRLIAETPLNFLLKNLNPGLACEIKECWIEPNSFAIDTFLGKGT